MSALRELQSRFRAAIVEGDEAPLLPALVEPAEVARRRLAAYRRSVFGNLTGALSATYPVVEAIVGDAFFREAARRYVLACPSASGDLDDYGGDFAAFLETYPHAAELPYLPDVARLEWQVQMVYYAADAAPADLSLLTAAPPARYAELCFELASDHARLDSRWPLADIWRVNQPGHVGAMAVDFSVGARLLIVRVAGHVRVEALAAGEAAFFDALATGQTLAAANAAGVAAESATETGFDPGPALQRLAALGLLLRANF